MRTIRLPYRDGKVADDYSAELVDYITPEKFQQRVANFNNVAMQYGVSRVLLALPVFLVWLTIIIVVPISIEHETSKKDQKRIVPLVIAALLVFFSVIAAGLLTITIIRRANRLKATALHELLNNFNAEDNQEHVNWRIFNDSGGPVDKESRRYSGTPAERCLIIEIGIESPMLATTAGNSAMHQLLFDKNQPQNPPPPYDIAFKDPPPALSPSQTSRRSIRSLVLSSGQTSLTLSSIYGYSNA